MDNVEEAIYVIRYQAEVQHIRHADLNVFQSSALLAVLHGEIGPSECGTPYLRYGEAALFGWSAHPRPCIIED